MPGIRLGDRSSGDILVGLLSCCLIERQGSIGDRRQIVQQASGGYPARAPGMLPAAVLEQPPPDRLEGRRAASSHSGTSNTWAARHSAEIARPFQSVSTLSSSAGCGRANEHRRERRSSSLKPVISSSSWSAPGTPAQDRAALPIALAVTSKASLKLPEATPRAASTSFSVQVARRALSGLGIGVQGGGKGAARLDIAQHEVDRGDAAALYRGLGASACARASNSTNWALLYSIFSKCGTSQRASVA